MRSSNYSSLNNQRKFILLFFLLTIKKNKIYSSADMLSQNYNPISMPMNNGMGGNYLPGMNQPLNAQLPVGTKPGNTNQANPYGQAGSDYTWKNQTQIDSLNSHADANVNWQERKILKQKMNIIYSEILSIIDDSRIVIEKFNSKQTDFNTMYNNCIHEINEKLRSHNNTLNLEQLKNTLQDIKIKFEGIKKSNLYLHDKEFANKVNDHEYMIGNLDKMIAHGADSLQQLQSSFSIIISAIQNLSTITKKIDEYENTSWKMYQKIDELINEYEATSNSEVIINCSENIKTLNYYLRNNFLEYMNEAINNCESSIEAIINLYNNIGSYITELNKTLDTFNGSIEYARQEEEQKKIQAAEAEKQAEQRRQEAEEKKKMDALKAAQLSQTIWDKAGMLFTQVINKIQLKIQLLIARVKSTDIVQKVSSLFYAPPTTKTTSTKIDPQNTVVNSNLTQYIAPTEVPLKEEPLSILPTPDIAIPQIARVDLNAPQSTPDQNQIPSSTILEDVFNAQKQQNTQYEQTIPGASSYAAEIVPMIAERPYDNTANEEQPAQLLATETVIENPQNENDSNTTEENNQNNNTFRYTPLEINRSNDGEDNKSLLPDLSHLMVTQGPINVAERSGVMSGINNANTAYDNSGSGRQGEARTLEMKQQNIEAARERKENKKSAKKNRRKKKKENDAAE
jgi:hypothetical protein